MPCLNEAATVGSCVVKARGFLERAGIDGEVLIADNGSDDGSRALAERAGARVIEVAERSYGAALAGGIAAARGRSIIIGDADDSYDFARLEGFLAKLGEGYPLRTGVAGRRICEAGATAGGIFGFCCSSARAGCFSIQGSPCWRRASA